MVTKLDFVIFLPPYLFVFCLITNIMNHNFYHLVRFLLVLGFLFLVVMIMVYGAKYGSLGKSGLFERRTTLPVNYNKVDRELKRLVGRNGKTISKLDLAGKAGRVHGKLPPIRAHAGRQRCHEDQGVFLQLLSACRTDRSDRIYLPCNGR